MPEDSFLTLRYSGLGPPKQRLPHATLLSGIGHEKPWVLTPPALGQGLTLNPPSLADAAKSFGLIDWRSGTVIRTSSAQGFASYAAAHELAHAPYAWNVEREMSYATVRLDSAAVASAIDFVRSGSYGLAPATDIDGGFLPLGQMGRDRSLRAWSRAWGAHAFKALVLGLTVDRLRQILLERRRRIRANRSRSWHSHTRRLAGQLERLANAIIPHAPPTSALPNHCSG